MKSPVIYLLLSLVFISCAKGPKKSWPEKDRADFMESCIANAKSGIGEEKAKKYCACMLEKIMVRYPDIKDAEDIKMGETIELAQQCQKMDTIQQK